jgi:hypothetical protein
MAARAIWISSSTQSTPWVLPTSRALASRVPTMAAAMPIRMLSQIGMAWRPGEHQAAERPDAQADDDGADDAGDGHRVSFLTWGYLARAGRGR